MERSPVEAKTIVLFGSLVADLQALQPNLAFAQGQVCAAFREILKSKQDNGFQLEEELEENWCDAMAKRLRTMARHAGQTILKHPRA